MANNISNIDPAKIKSVAGHVDSTNSDLQNTINRLRTTVDNLQGGYQSQASPKLIQMGQEIHGKLNNLSAKVGDFTGALHNMAAKYGGHDEEALSSVKSFDGVGDSGSGNVNTISAQLTAEKI